MHSESPRDEFTSLPKPLKARLNIIVQTVPKFWNSNRHYNHFTNHGPEHSERIYSQKLAQLAQGLPEVRRLNNEEVFVVSAAAWLYEIGMQSPNLRPILDFDHRPGDHLSFSQLQKIRDNKHLLTKRLITDSVRRDYDGRPLQLGLATPADDYTNLIAEVCRWCSDDPLQDVPESLPVSGIPVRVRLLVALLRLADQLYIDSSRINLDILERCNPPIDQLARWWAYHYVQTLPITQGKVRFHYFLPSTQKQYLGHLRSLVEPRFEYRRNPLIQYLSDEQQLHLIPHRTPTFQFDQPDGFLREMDGQIIRYLRQEVERIDTAISVSEPREPNERCLLILDYESFVTQLGREGHYPIQDDLGHLVVTFLTKAGEQYAGTVDALAIGHWDRPDLAQAAEMLTGRIYELLTIEDDEGVSEKLEVELNERLHEPNAPTQIILVAPRQALAPTVKRIAAGRRPVTAWISSLPEADIYRAITREHRFLSDVLDLEDIAASEPAELESLETACILRMEHWLANRDAEAIPLRELPEVLEEISSIRDRVRWWQLWLVNRGILAVLEAPGQQSVARLVTGNPSVERVRRMQDAAIEALQTLSQDSEDVPQDRLVEQLAHSSYFESEEHVLDFLGLLKTEGAVYRKSGLGSLQPRPVWQLNPSHRAVVLLNVDSYLPKFILAFDHGLLREGHHFAHVSRLPQYLSPHFRQASTVETLYELASNRRWVRRRETSRKRRYGDGHVVHVKIAEDHVPVAKILRNRDIVLNILSHSSAKNGKERHALWQKLKGIKAFTLPRKDFEQLLSLLKDDSVVVESGQNQGRDVVKLNLEALLTQRLLGRLYLHGLVRNLRIMRATSSSSRKPVDQLLGKLTKFVTHHDRQLAEWTLDYAKCIKLVKIEEDFVFLNRHGFVHQLDQREEQVGQALVELMQELARPGSGGWVPRYVVRDKMQDDIEQFGYTLGELDYWIDQAIYRLRILEKQRIRVNGRSQEVVRAQRRAS